MSTYRLRVVYAPHPARGAANKEVDPSLETEEETVDVPATSLAEAVRRAMLYTRTRANGRLVRYFDEAKQECFNGW
jgi:hypothetical protein